MDTTVHTPLGGLRDHEGASWWRGERQKREEEKEAEERGREGKEAEERGRDGKTEGRREEIIAALIV